MAKKMSELDLKALEAAQTEAAKRWGEQHGGWDWNDIQRIIQTFLNAADLVPRSELERRDRLGLIELQGRDARLSGKSSKSNPHQRATDEGEMWFLGWQDEDAHCTLKRERDEARRKARELARTVDQEIAEVELQTGLAETRGKMIAVLRKALRDALTMPYSKIRDRDRIYWEKGWTACATIVKAVFTDTTAVERPE